MEGRPNRQRGPVRALLISIEEDGNDIAPPVGQSAEILGLRRWLIEQRGARVEDVIICAGPGGAERTFGNTHDELLAAVHHLVAVGADQTAELYVFIAGRGLREAGSPFSHAVDLLAPPELVGPDQAAACALPLLALQRHLACALGPGTHYFFVDARVVTSAAPTEPVAFKLTPRRSIRGRADSFMLLVARNDRGLRAERHLAGLLCRFLRDEEAGRAREPFTQLADSGGTVEHSPYRTESHSSLDPFARLTKPGSAVEHSPFRTEPHSSLDPFARLTEPGSPLERFTRLADRIEPYLAAQTVERIAPMPPASVPPRTTSLCALTHVAETPYDATDWLEVIGKRLLRSQIPSTSALFDATGAPETEGTLYLFVRLNAPGRAAATALDEVALRPTAWTEGGVEGWCAPPPGPLLLSLKVPGWQPLELATCVLFGHATVLILVEDGGGRLDLRQAILPVPARLGRLHGPLRDPGRALRCIAAGQQRFARGLLPLTEQSAWERARWADLRAARWIDPVLSTLTAYALLRRSAGADREAVIAIVRALRTRYPGLPDTEVLAALAGLESYSPTGWPLCVDGALAMIGRPLPGVLTDGHAWTIFRRGRGRPPGSLGQAAPSEGALQMQAERRCREA